MLSTLERQASIAARLRHQSRLHEHTLTGSGRYWQQGTGVQRVSRWEMQTQVAGKTASIVQIYDGNHLWTDRRLPSGREVHRLDVARLHARLRKGGPNRTRSNTSRNDSVEKMLAAAEGRGGLAQMLAELLTRFNFDPPRHTQLNGLAVNALVGRWQIPKLEALWPKGKYEPGGDPPSWPEQLPHHVLVLVGKNNLFPYVIEHRRASDAYLAGTVAGLRPTRDPLVRYEIFEVQYAAAMDRRLFEFKPGDVQWTDETALVLERMREQQGLVAQRAKK